MSVCNSYQLVWFTAFTAGLETTTSISCYCFWAIIRLPSTNQNCDLSSLYTAVSSTKKFSELTSCFQQCRTTIQHLRTSFNKFKTKIRPFMKLNFESYETLLCHSVLQFTALLACLNVSFSPYRKFWFSIKFHTKKM